MNHRLLAAPRTPAAPAMRCRRRWKPASTRLTSQFDTQQAQLSALQSLLLDARIESSVKPTGMPVQGYISSCFGVRADPFDGQSELHTGIDIATP
ncbi:MAG: hypothetical protein ABI129_06195 [Rhodanobacter sp.]